MDDKKTNKDHKVQNNIEKTIVTKKIVLDIKKNMDNDNDKCNNNNNNDNGNDVDN